MVGRRLTAETRPRAFCRKTIGDWKAATGRNANRDEADEPAVFACSVVAWGGLLGLLSWLGHGLKTWVYSVLHGLDPGCSPPAQALDPHRLDIEPNWLCQIVNETLYCQKSARCPLSLFLIREDLLISRSLHRFDIKTLKYSQPLYHHRIHP